MHTCQHESWRFGKAGRFGAYCALGIGIDHVEVMALQLHLFLVTCVTLVPQLEELTDLKEGL
jgi:hypothetical protein